MRSTLIRQDDYINIMTGVTRRDKEEDRKEIDILEEKEGIVHKDYSIEGLHKRLNKLRMRNDY